MIRDILPGLSEEQYLAILLLRELDTPCVEQEIIDEVLDKDELASRDRADVEDRTRTSNVKRIPFSNNKRG